jgi:hypothetical protein
VSHHSTEAPGFIPRGLLLSVGLDTLPAMQELVQVLGAVVTILGLVVVAPYEAGRVPPAMWNWITRAGGRARSVLSRWLPFLRRNITVNVGDMVALTGLGTLSAWGRVGVTDKGTREEQLTAIRAALVSIHGELDGLRAEDTAIRAELTAKFNQLAEEHAALRQAHDEQRHEQGQINARGFPLAAVGALLAGLPGSCLAAAGWWLGGPLVAVGVVAAGIGCRWLWEARHKLAEGLHSFRPPAQQPG